MRGGIEDNSKIVFLISQQKHIVTQLIICLESGDVSVPYSAPDKKG